MPYLNLDLDYFDHPKTKRLVGLLGRGSDVLPVRLWCYCGKFHADTGDMTGYSPIELENLIGWWGQPGKAVEALAKLQFLDPVGAGYKVHDWAHINGHIAALKERAQAGAAERWRRYREERDAQAMLKHSLSYATSNAPSDPTKDKDLRRIQNDLNSVGPEHRMPAKRDPETIPEARRRMAKAAKIDLLQDPTVVFFDDARKSYPGSKGGLTAEWKNFEFKYKDDLEIILPLLAPAIQREAEYKAALKAAALFVPQWKNFGTWINNRCWEQEFGKVESNGSQNGGGRGNSGGYESAAQRNARKLKANLGLDQPAGIGETANSVFLPVLPPGATGGGFA